MIIKHPRLIIKQHGTIKIYRYVGDVSNIDDGDELHSAGTLTGMLILARKQGIHDKQAIKSGMTCKLA